MEREVDLLEEDIVVGVGRFLKRKELGCCQQAGLKSMQPRRRKARPALDMNPDSLRVNVQTATEAVFSPKGEQP